jgi:hypothetical protein
LKSHAPRKSFSPLSNIRAVTFKLCTQSSSTAPQNQPASQLRARKHYPNWILQSVVGLLLTADTINIGADLGAMGDAVDLLIG